MSRLQLYIATSLDGYIAAPDGGLDWLEKFPTPDQLDYGYADFYDQVDTVVLGRHTYETIQQYDVEWPYKNCKSYIATTQSNNPITKYQSPTFIYEYLDGNL